MKEVNKNKSIKKLTDAKFEFDINQIEAEDLKWYNKGLAWVFLFLQIFNILIIVDKMIYSNIAKIVLFASIVNCILILSNNKKNPKKALYKHGSIHLNLTILTIYIYGLNFINLQGDFAKAMFMVEYIIINLVFILKRVVTRNEEIKNSIGTPKARKYLKKDLIICTCISLATTIFAKIQDGTSLFTSSVEKDMAICGIIFAVIIPIASVASIYGMAFYRNKLRANTENIN